MKQRFFILFLSIQSVLCIAQNNPDVIVKNAIKAHGSSQIDGSEIRFTFRDAHFTINKKNGNFSYQKSFKKDGDLIVDHLNNNGFTRKVNDTTVDLSSKQSQAYSNSLNSVVYFSLIPEVLNDPAVHLKYIGENTVKGKKYFKVQVTFDVNGGGDDHDDVYVYWIDQEQHTIDYLAYSFHVNGGGVRFRVATDFVQKSGIRFQQYANYKSDDKTIPVKDLDNAFVEGKLVKVSEIVLEKIKVSKSSN